MWQTKAGGLYSSLVPENQLKDLKSGVPLAQVWEATGLSCESGLDAVGDGGLRRGQAITEVPDSLSLALLVCCFTIGDHLHWCCLFLRVMKWGPGGRWGSDLFLWAVAVLGLVNDSARVTDTHPCMSVHPWMSWLSDGLLPSCVGPGALRRGIGHIASHIVNVVSADQTSDWTNGILTITSIGQWGDTWETFPTVKAGYCFVVRGLPGPPHSHVYWRVLLGSVSPALRLLGHSPDHTDHPPERPPLGWRSDSWGRWEWFFQDQNFSN